MLASKSTLSYKSTHVKYVTYPASYAAILISQLSTHLFFSFPFLLYHTRYLIHLIQLISDYSKYQFDSSTSLFPMIDSDFDSLVG